MRTYWDTSAAINAAISPEVFHRLKTGEHVARLHLLAEFFATMTGRGVEITDEAGNAGRLAFTQSECAAWLKNFAQRGLCCIIHQRFDTVPLHKCNLYKKSHPRTTPDIVPEQSVRYRVTNWHDYNQSAGSAWRPAALVQ